MDVDAVSRLSYLHTLQGIVSIITFLSIVCHLHIVDTCCLAEASEGQLKFGSRASAGKRI